MANKHNKRQSCGRKRKFRGNKYTKSAKSTSSTSDDHGQVGEQQETHQAASPNVDISSESSLSDNPLDCNIFLNLACFNNFLASYLICPKCFNYSLNLFLNESARIGFCQELIVKCTSADCSFEESFRSSKENRDGQKRGFREINLRMVSFVRSIGPGHSALLNFCQHTNSPPPISETSYQSVMHTIGLASKKVAEESMEKAAREVKEKVGISNEEGITDCGVSVDGTWQRRGHSSHHGVVTAISIETGKCLDAEILTNSCRLCTKWSSKKGTADYDKWITKHKCKVNHVGSSGEPSDVLYY